MKYGTIFNEYEKLPPLSKHTNDDTSHKTENKVLFFRQPYIGGIKI